MQIDIKKELNRIETEWNKEQDQLKRLLTVVKTTEERMKKLKNIYDYLAELEKTKKNK